MDLINEWNAWEPGRAPFIFPKDRAVLESERAAERVLTLRSWSEAHSTSDFCAPIDSRLHLGLLPMPFIGDLRQASIYVLLLNPGVGPHDYYGEYEVPAYRRALNANLKQQIDAGSLPFIFLDPKHSWHGGFGWWHGKLAAVIERLSAALGVSFAAARAKLGTELASLELLPYHSAKFRDHRWLQSLPSVELARSFVKQVVVPRVQRGEATVIVTRQTALWGLPPHPGVVEYTGGQARAAHLTPSSPGGRAILNQILSPTKLRSSS